MLHNCNDGPLIISDNVLTILKIVLSLDWARNSTPNRSEVIRDSSLSNLSHEDLCLLSTPSFLNVFWLSFCLTLSVMPSLLCLCWIVLDISSSSSYPLPVPLCCLYTLVFLTLSICLLVLVVELCSIWLFLFYPACVFHEFEYEQTEFSLSLCISIIEKHNDNNHHLAYLKIGKNKQPWISIFSQKVTFIVTKKILKIHILSWKWRHIDKSSRVGGF